MEKQTKILLGVGAVIAAYLILKPKKSVTSTAIKEEKPQPKVTGGYPCPDGTIDYNYTDNGVMSPCVGHKGENPSLSKLELSKVLEELKKLQSKTDPRKEQSQGTCNCFRAPCNCGGGGVSLDKLLSTQSSEY